MNKKLLLFTILIITILLLVTGYNDSTIVEIAKNHNVTSAQVILRWNLQKGVSTIPGSSNSEHIKENTEIYHFELTDEEI